MTEDLLDSKWVIERELGGGGMSRAVRIALVPQFEPVPREALAFFWVPVAKPSSGRYPVFFQQLANGCLDLRGTSWGVHVGHVFS